MNQYGNKSFVIVAESLSTYTDGGREMIGRKETNCIIFYNCIV